MASTGFSVRIVPDEFGDNAANTARKAPKRMATAVKLIIEMAKSNIVAKTPIGHSAALAAGYQTEMRRRTKSVSGLLVNPVLYHDIRDVGRKRGRRPPTAALIPWVGSKLGVPPDQRQQVAFLVARKIGRVGYKGSDHVEKGFNKTRREAKAPLKKMGLRIAKDVRG